MPFGYLGICYNLTEVVEVVTADRVFNAFRLFGYLLLAFQCLSRWTTIKSSMPFGYLGICYFPEIVRVPLTYTVSSMPFGYLGICYHCPRSVVVFFAVRSSMPFGYLGICY